MSKVAKECKKSKNFDALKKLAIRILVERDVAKELLRNALSATISVKSEHNRMLIDLIELKMRYLIDELNII